MSEEKKPVEMPKDDKDGVGVVRQDFNQIKEVKALNGNIVLYVYQGKRDSNYKGADLKSVILTIKEAAERAKAINDMINAMRKQMPEKDIKICTEIVEEILRKIMEARTQRRKLALDPNIKMA